MLFLFAVKNWWDYHPADSSTQSGLVMPNILELYFMLGSNRIDGSVRYFCCRNNICLIAKQLFHNLTKLLLYLELKTQLWKFLGLHSHFKNIELTGFLKKDMMCQFQSRNFCLVVWSIHGIRFLSELCDPCVPVPIQCSFTINRCKESKISQSFYQAIEMDLIIERTSSAL